MRGERDFGTAIGYRRRTVVLATQAGESEVGGVGGNRDWMRNKRRVDRRRSPPARGLFHGRFGIRTHLAGLEESMQTGHASLAKEKKRKNPIQ